MAIIGFIVLLAIGVYFAWCALGGSYVAVLFSGKMPWAYFIVTLSISVASLYFAVINAPFKVTIQ